MITDSRLNPTLGISMASKYIISSDLQVNFRDNKIIIKDELGQDQVQMLINNNILEYQVYDQQQQQWGQQQSLTPAQSQDNSVNLPHNFNQDYLQIDNQGFKVVIGGQTKMSLLNSVVLNNIQILGVQTSADPTSAVNLSQLQNIQPFNLQYDPQTLQSLILDQNQQQMLIFDTRVRSNLPIEYLQRPAQFLDAFVPDSQYVRDQIALTQLLSEKGQPDGYTPLNSQGQVSSQYLPVLQLNQVYVGNDIQKTDPNFFPQTPLVGTMFIAIDTQSTYILSDPNFQLIGSWIELAPVNPVLSVNSLTGNVVLDTDDINQGITNLYFQSGIASYLINSANTANNLLKLNNNTQIDSSLFANPFKLQNGVIKLYDDQIANFSFQNSSTSANIFNISTSDITSYFPISYNSHPTFTNDTQIIDKKYVDDIAATKLNISDAYDKTTIDTFTLNKWAQPTTSLDLGLQKIINLSDGTLATDAVTKQQLDLKADTTTLSNYYLNTTPLQSITLASADLNINNHKITNLSDGTLATDSVTKQQLDLKADTATLSNYYLNTTPLQSITLASADLNINNHKITNLSVASSTTDAASLANSLDQFAQPASVLTYASTPTLNSNLQIPTKQYVDLSMPVGVIQAYYGASAPNSNWLICNGSTYSSVTYPFLFALLGTTTLPDFRGYFLRGLDTTGTVDPQIRTIGSSQTDDFKSHTHLLDRRSNADSGAFDASDSHGSQSCASTTDRAIVAGFSVSSTGGTETRPKNKAVNYIIKAA